MSGNAGAAAPHDPSVDAAAHVGGDVALLEAACGFHCGRAGNFMPNPHLRPDIDTARLVGMPTGESTIADVVPITNPEEGSSYVWFQQVEAGTDCDDIKASKDALF